MTDIALEPDAGWAHRIHFESRPNAALAARAAGVPVLDVVVPVYNEQAALADSVHRLHRHLREQLPVRGAHHDRRQRQRRRHAPHRGGTRRRADRRPGRAAGAEGPRPRAARGVVDLGRAGAGLHGRRPVHRPRRARPAGRAADLRPLRPGDRHPAGPGRAGGARAEARDHLALLQPDPEIDAGRALLRRAVRVQGHPRRRRRSACCRTSPTPAGSSTPNCWCSPSAAACASTKCRWTGSTTPTAGSTSSPPRPPTSRASGGCCAASPTARSR